MGAGYSLKKYGDKIKEFINNNNVIIVGCNNIMNFIIPDYHFWTDKWRYNKFGKNINSKSVLIFGGHMSKKLINKYYDGKYLIVNYKKGNKSQKKKVEYDKENDIFYGNFRTVGTLAILWAYVHKAKEINIVGMDGYSFHSKEDLVNNETSQHWYSSKGYSDKIGSPSKIKKYDNDTFYNFCITLDKQVYSTLRYIKEYGVKFKILTPTVYKDFYNKKILNLNE